MNTCGTWFAEVNDGRQILLKIGCFSSIFSMSIVSKRSSVSLSVPFQLLTDQVTQERKKKPTQLHYSVHRKNLQGGTIEIQWLFYKFTKKENMAAPTSKI